jgi:hypothetical protein
MLKDVQLLYIYIYISSLFSFQECQRPVCICIPSTAKSMHPKENSCHPLQNQQKISHNRRKFQQHAWVNSLYFSIHLSWQWMHVLRGKATYDISFKACIVAKNGANYLLIKYETWYVTHTFFVHLFFLKKKKKINQCMGFITKYTAMGLIGAIITHFSCQDAERTRTSK